MSLMTETRGMVRRIGWISRVLPHPSTEEPLSSRLQRTRRSFDRLMDTTLADANIPSPTGQEGISISFTVEPGKKDVSLRRRGDERSVVIFQRNGVDRRTEYVLTESQEAISTQSTHKPGQLIPIRDTHQLAEVRRELALLLKAGDLTNGYALTHGQPDENPNFFPLARTA